MLGDFSSPVQGLFYYRPPQHVAEFWLTRFSGLGKAAAIYLP
jgi:hypothetical protein